MHCFNNARKSKSFNLFPNGNIGRGYSMEDCPRVTKICFNSFQYVSCLSFGVHELFSSMILANFDFSSVFCSKYFLLKP